MTKTDAEARLGFRLGELIEHAVPAAKMLSKIADENTIKETKEKVYRNIRVAQTAFILFSTFLDLRPVSDASD
jgi:hypothetical protein